MSLRWAPQRGGLLLFSVVSGALNARVVRGQLPFAAGVYERIRACRVIIGVSLVSLLVVSPVLSRVVNQTAGVLTMLALAATAGTAWLVLVSQGQLAVRSIDDGFVHLELPRTEVAREFAERLEQGSLGLGPELASVLAGHANASRPAPPGASCPLHVSATSVWSCGRCGSFFCEACARRLSPSQVVCGPCFEAALKLTFAQPTPWWLYGAVVLGVVALVPGCLFGQALGVVVNGVLLVKPAKGQSRTLPAVGLSMSLAGLAASLWMLR